jgi:hypothetical protein
MAMTFVMNKRKGTMSKYLHRFSNLSVTTGLLIAIAALLLIAFKIFEISSDALLSLISAIIGGLIATSSQAWVSAQDRQNQLRLASVEKRLTAHQQAYSLWRRILANLGNEKALGDVVLESQTWWENNCLYLDSNAREAFVRAYLSAGSHKVMVLSRDITLIEKSMQTIINAGQAIVAGVSLPTIGEFENKTLSDEKTKKK